MSRRLPPTITADQPPDWLPFGWLAHSTVLKRGRQTKTYTHIKTGKKLSTKDQVLEYDEMYKVREKRHSEIERRNAHIKAIQDRETLREERPSWLPDGDCRTKLRVDSFVQNPIWMHADTSKGLETHIKEEVLLHHTTVEISSSSEEEEAGCNQISYIIEEDEEELSESEYVDVKGSMENVSTCLRSPLERLQKLESRAKTQCVFEDEEMSSDSEDKLPVAERVDKAREIPGLSGSFSIEINVACEPASDNLMENDRNRNGTEGTATQNIEIRDQESDLVNLNALSKVVEVTQESGDKSEEPLKETASESRRSVMFPSVVDFDNSNARSLAEDHSNTIGLGLNLQEKNINGSEKRKKSTDPCSSKNIEKKDTKAPTKKLQKRKASPSIQLDDWPEPCPNFAFEPIKSSTQIDEDDSVICRYLEQHFLSVENGDSSNLPLPDFGLPSFSNLTISPDKEPDSERKKSPDTPCVHVASSSLPSSSSIGTTTTQQTVAGNR